MQGPGERNKLRLAVRLQQEAAGKTTGTHNRPRLNSVKTRSAAIMLVAFGLATALSYGAIGTTTLSVSVTVQATCLVSPSPLSFESYISGKWNVEKNVSVTCNSPTGYTLGIVQSPPGAVMASLPAGTAGQGGIGTSAFGSSLRGGLNFDHVTIGTDSSHLEPRYFPAPSSDSVIIAVTY